MELIYFDEHGPLWLRPWRWYSNW